MLVPLHSQIYYKMLVPLNSHIYYKILLKIPIQGANNILCVCFYMCVMHFKIPTKRGLDPVKWKHNFVTNLTALSPNQWCSSEGQTGSLTCVLQHKTSYRPQLHRDRTTSHCKYNFSSVSVEKPDIAPRTSDRLTKYTTRVTRGY